MTTTCQQCEYDGTNCLIRYLNDLQEFGVVEWICPRCGQSHIKKDADFTCKVCGFGYECQ